jgi:hypothetical protein
LPRSTKARSSWNYRTWAKDGGLATSTHYWMNSLQGLTDKGDFVVTINHPEQVDPAKVIVTIPTEHPLSRSKPSPPRPRSPRSTPVLARASTSPAPGSVTASTKTASGRPTACARSSSAATPWRPDQKASFCD